MTASWFHKTIILFIGLYNLCLPLGVNAQGTSVSDSSDLELHVLEIKQADILEAKKDSRGELQKLIGNVILQQEDVIMWCDSAYFYFNDNDVKAYGDVIVEKGDSVQISADQVLFNGDTQQATLIGNAKVTDGSSVLISDKLNYNVSTKRGSYTTGGEFQTGTTVLQSQHAYYYGEIGEVDFVDSVILNSPTYAMVTDSMHYDLENDLSHFEGNTIIETEGNTITTQSGFYDMKNDKAAFGSGAKVVGEERNIEADSLYLDQASGISYASGNAKVLNDGRYIEAETIYSNEEAGISWANGDVYIEDEEQIISADSLYTDEVSGYSKAYGEVYLEKDGQLVTASDSVINDTQTGLSEAYGSVIVADSSQVIEADKLIFNNESGEGEAYGDVFWNDSIQGVTIFSDYAEFARDENYVLAAGHSLMINVVDGDTLYLAADTLITKSEGADSARFFTAYPDVRIFKSDMQALCDSMKYDGRDSTFFFYEDPILWVDSTQLTADTIILKTKNSQLSEIELMEKALIITVSAKEVFDQIFGNTIHGHFTENRINDLEVEGKAFSIYFIKNEREEYTGYNQANAESMDVFFSEESQVSKIGLGKNASAKFIPIQKADPYKARLRMFKWHVKKRPKSLEDIYSFNSDS